VSGRRNGRQLKHGDSAGSFHVWFRSVDGEAVSEDSRSHKRCKGTLLFPAGDQVASLGIPTPKPNAPASPQPSPTGQLQVIGSVRIEAAHFYRIRFVDREMFEGHAVYRLALEAYYNPNEHPLTGMLVDANTFLVRQAQGEVAGHWVLASGGAKMEGVFDRVGPYWILRDERFSFAANAVVVHARGSASMHGADFSFPTDLSRFFPSPSPSPTRR